jgi:hypothetical protein
MMSRSKGLIAVGLCMLGLSAAVAVVSTEAGAGNAKTTNVRVTNVTGVWRAYDPANAKAPIWMFILRNKAGSGKITGNWEALAGGGDIFTDPGTVSPSGVALLRAGGGQPGVETNMDFTVKFIFKSNSPAATNHPTFSGTWDNVWAIGAQTGQQEGTTTGTVRAVRCSATTTAKAIAACRY